MARWCRLVLKGIEEEAFIWWQNSGNGVKGRSWEIAGGDRLCTGRLASKLPSQSPPLVCCLYLHSLGKVWFLLIVNPGEFAAVIWACGGGVDPVPVIWGDWVLIRWPAHVPGSIKGAERGGLRIPRPAVLPRSLLTCLDLFLSEFLPWNPFDSVAEEWRKRYVLFPELSWLKGPFFCRKPLCFNPRMSPLCGEISLKLPKANRMENKRQLTLIVLFIYIT